MRWKQNGPDYEIGRQIPSIRAGGGLVAKRAVEKWLRRYITSKLKI